MQGRGEFRVSVEKDYLVFASAHFITMSGHRCEGLHGHNYRARVTIEGALNEENWFVFDFVEIKRIMRKLCDEIDHLVLLPTESPRIQVVEEGERVTVAVDGQPGTSSPPRLRPAADSEHDRGNAGPAADRAAVRAPPGDRRAAV